MGWDFNNWSWLVLVQHELLLFAAFFFLIGALDDLAVDLTWIWLKITGRTHQKIIDRAQFSQAELSGKAAIFIPAWQEEQVIGDTVRHLLSVWKQRDLMLYVGCYRNDPATITAVMQAASGDKRLRIVIHDRCGPSTKADCLNRLYLALRDDEQRSSQPYRMVVFHDAEDMVDPAALALLDDAIGDAAFVQLPVEPVAQKDSRWLGSHYCEEFAEAHSKAMVVRDALGAALPAAGVGFAVSREALENMRAARTDALPFATDSLTEDYELGFAIVDAGLTCRFIKAIGDDGRQIATRAYFPSRLEMIVRQKTRWVHGISLQGWDRVGWSDNLIDTWMRARDRRGPLTALILLIGYTLLALAALQGTAIAMGFGQAMALSGTLKALLIVNVIAFAWRAGMRFAFTAKIYGVAEGIRAVLRIPVANVIAIMAGRRAVAAYLRSLSSGSVVWDKTPHHRHPAQLTPKTIGAA